MAASVKCQIKPIIKIKTNCKTRKKKTIEGILFHVFNEMVTRIKSRSFSNLFVLCWKLSDLFHKVSTALRRFPIFIALDFPELLDDLGKS